MVGSEVYSNEVKKTEVLMENFRRAIGEFSSLLYWNHYRLMVSGCRDTLAPCGTRRHLADGSLVPIHCSSILACLEPYRYHSHSSNHNTRFTLLVQLAILPNQCQTRASGNENTPLTPHYVMIIIRPPRQGDKRSLRRRSNRAHARRG